MLSAPGLVPDPPRKDSESLSGGLLERTRVVIRGLAMVLSLANPRSGQLLQEGLGSKAMAEGSTEVREGVDRKPSSREGLDGLSLPGLASPWQRSREEAWLLQKTAGSGPSKFY